MNYRVISADSHVNEPPGTFVERVPSRLRERAPHVVPMADGGEGWIFDDRPPQGFGLKWGGKKFSEIIRGGWDPEHHLKDLEADGTWASVVYFGVAANVYNMKDPELRVACLRAYNDWLAEFCAFAPDRLVGPAMLPTEEDGIGVAVAELQRTAKVHGARTAQVPIFPWRRYHETYYDPLWAAAQEMDLPLALHRGLQRPFSFGAVSGQGPWMANQVMRDFSYVMPIADLIFGGVFDRFPKLKIVSAEGRTGWLPHFVQRADDSLKRHEYWVKSGLKRAPSEYVKNNIYATFIEDRVGILMRDMIGVDNQMWSSDYPHTDGSWPRSMEVIDEQFRGVPPEDKRKMLADNAIRLYRLKQAQAPG